MHPFAKSEHNLFSSPPTTHLFLSNNLSLVTVRTLKKWSQEAEEELRGCFESTDWNALCEPHGDDITSMTDYINFPVEHLTVPTRTVRCFSNNKPWITSDLKKLLYIKTKAFREGSRKLLRTVNNSRKGTHQLAFMIYIYVSHSILPLVVPENNFL